MNKDDADIDEDKVQQDHKQAYSQGNAGNMSANAIGSYVVYHRTIVCAALSHALTSAPPLCKPSSSSPRAALAPLSRAREETT